MTPEAWCCQMAQRKTIERKKRIRAVPGVGYFRVYWLNPRKEVGPFSTIERAWLADANFYRASERFVERRANYMSA